MRAGYAKIWNDEKSNVKSKIKAVEKLIHWANKKSKAAMTRGLRSEDNKVKDTCFKQFGDCEIKIADSSEQPSSLQKKLARLCEKETKGKL